MKYDVIIIGAGLSGLMAAKTAAEKGLKVLVLAKGMGMVHSFWGGIDLLGYYPEESRTMLEDLRSGLENLTRDNPTHPYAKVGLEDVQRSLDAFSDLFDSKGYHYTRESWRNILLPTGFGSLRPAHMVPSTMIPGSTLLSEATLLVGFHEFGNFFPAYAAKNLQAHITKARDMNIRGASIGISDIAGRTAFKAGPLALQFEDDAFRAAVANRIKKIKGEENLIAFAAVLGLKNAQDVKSDLEARIGARVFELPILPPSIPGMRVFDTFQKELRGLRVRMTLGFEVGYAIFKNRHCQGVVLKTPAGERVHHADAFVLATGRFLGGGLQEKNGRIVEPLFNLPVAQPKTKDHWFLDEFLGRKGHPINRSGIMTNSRLNPVDGNGKTLFENLYVVGSLLGHHDSLREKSAGGVDISTGYRAIRNLIG
jgi:glycerol-3-phosphate dehydrogenase subunit B